MNHINDLNAGKGMCEIKVVFAKKVLPFENYKTN